MIFLMEQWSQILYYKYVFCFNYSAQNPDLKFISEQLSCNKIHSYYKGFIQNLLCCLEKSDIKIILLMA